MEFFKERCNFFIYYFTLFETTKQPKITKMELTIMIFSLLQKKLQKIFFLIAPDILP